MMVGRPAITAETEALKATISGRQRREMLPISRHTSPWTTTQFLQQQQHLFKAPELGVAYSVRVHFHTPR